MGWTFRWASSLDSDFNYDFNTSFTEEQQRSGSIDYNYGPQDTTWLREAGASGPAGSTPRWPAPTTPPTSASRPA